jgi:hypothetical protein
LAGTAWRRDGYHYIAIGGAAARELLVEKIIYYQCLIWQKLAHGPLSADEKRRMDGGICPDRKSSS